MGEFEIAKWISLLAAGGGIAKVLDIIFSRKRAQLENDKILVETDRTASDTWERLCNRLDKQIGEQQVVINQLQIENLNMRNELIQLRHLINFSDAKA